ncbi:MAG: hypothetical protein QXN63_04030, partial [Candidatus Bathyarchaeia archaeon]
TETTSGTMNFFLTNGETLWGFRLGHTLYYYHSETSPQYSAIASQPPTYNAEDWKELRDYNLIILRIGSQPTIIGNVTEIPENPILPSILLLTLTFTAALTYIKRKRGKT